MENPIPLTEINNIDMYNEYVLEIQGKLFDLWVALGNDKYDLVRFSEVFQKCFPQQN